MLMWWQETSDAHAQQRKATCGRHMAALGGRFMSQGKLIGKTAIVSGGSRGIGQGIALAMAHEGADIAFCHFRD